MEYVADEPRREPRVGGDSPAPLHQRRKRLPNAIGVVSPVHLLHEGGVLDNSILSLVNLSQAAGSPHGSSKTVAEPLNPGPGRRELLLLGDSRRVDQRCDNICVCYCR